jgi:hypothetical protein
MNLVYETGDRLRHPFYIFWSLMMKVALDVAYQNEIAVVGIVQFATEPENL